MNRRKARELALQHLFQSEFKVKGEQFLPLYILQQGEKMDGEKGFANELVHGALSHAEEIDSIILLCLRQKFEAFQA